MPTIPKRILVFVAVLCCLAICALALYQFLPMTHLHGQALAKLSDGKLLKTVEAQNRELIRESTNEKAALQGMSPERRTVYVLSTYEEEIEGGGLCLFFVNDTRLVAPYVEESLKAAGANDHLALFSDFIVENGIDVGDLQSFAIGNVEEFSTQQARYDFAAFDEQYYKLPSLKDTIIAFIRTHIDKF